LKKVPSDIKELFFDNFSSLLKYMKNFNLNFQQTLNDFNKAKDFVDKNLSGKNFESLRKNIFEGSM
jgi:hypothetical protein